MSETQRVELTTKQRDVLLRGLRYVRSSIMLDPHDPNPEDDARRHHELDEIAELVNYLNGNAPSRATADV